MRTLTAFLGLLLLAAVACNGDGDGGDGETTTSEPTTTTAAETTTSAGDTTTTGAGLALTQSCTNAEDGYSLDYPEDWFTNDGEVIPTCRLFDVRPLQVEPGTEPDAPVIADVEPVAFERVSEPSRGEEVVAREEAMIAGRDAVRAVTRATEEAPLREPGDLQIAWFVDLAGDQTFILSGVETPMVTFEQVQQVVDQMIETVEFTE